MLLPFQIPGTLSQAIFIPRIPGQSFSPLYYAQNPSPEVILGSVNAGSSNQGAMFCSVGGHGVNGAFTRVLQQSGQNTDLYQQIHLNLLPTSSDSPVPGIADSFPPDSPLQFAFLQEPQDQKGLFLNTSQVNLSGKNVQAQVVDGTVFIDIFKSEMTPGKKHSNYAMVYLVPPNGVNYPSQEAFLQAIEKSAVNLIHAVSQYNQGVSNRSLPTGLLPLTHIRMSLFSSGIYNSFDLPIEEIAKVHYQGYKEAMQAQMGRSGIHCLEFPEVSFASIWES